MSDSEFEDADPVPDGECQMEDEEEDDLLVGESGRATGEMDQDEEEEYDMEDDEEEADEAADEPTEEAVEPPKEVERASPAKASGKQKEKVPPKEEAAKKQSGPAKEAYVLRNGVAYQVPMSLDHKGPGRVRDYGNYIVVENDEVLGQMNLAKNWPKPADFPSTAIIVIKAKHQESDVLEATDLKGPFEWYARVVTKDDVEGRRTSSNSKIMKPLPSQLVQGLIKYLVNHKVFCVSSLITKYQPDSESKKPFPVDINGWEKVTGVKSTGTGPKKDAKPAKEPKEPAKSPPPPVDDNDLDDDLESEERVEQGSPSVKQPSKAKAAAPAPSPSDKKRSMSTSVAQLSLEAKKPVKKGGMLNFAKPTKPHAEGAASSSVGVPLPVAAKSPAPKPVEQPAPEKKAPEKPAEKPADKPVDKPAKPLRLAAASPAAASPAAASSSGQKRLLSTSDAEETAFKRVRKVDVDNASTTITFWKDNTLFIAEL